MITINKRDNLEWRPGMTIQDVLDAMRYTYHLITVTVNGEIVPKEDFDTYQIPDGADVRVFHIMHGG